MDGGCQIGHAVSTSQYRAAMGHALQAEYITVPYSWGGVTGLPDIDDLCKVAHVAVARDVVVGDVLAGVGVALGNAGGKGCRVGVDLRG